MSGCRHENSKTVSSFGCSRIPGRAGCKSCRGRTYSAVPASPCRARRRAVEFGFHSWRRTRESSACWWAARRPGRNSSRSRRMAHNWIARGNAEVQAANAPATRVTGTLDAEARRHSAEIRMVHARSEESFGDGGFCGRRGHHRTSHRGPETFYAAVFLSLRPASWCSIIIFFTSTPIVARLYDWQKKGEQSFAVLVPQTMTPGAVKVEVAGRRRRWMESNSKCCG